MFSSKTHRDLGILLFETCWYIEIYFLSNNNFIKCMKIRKQNCMGLRSLWTSIKTHNFISNQELWDTNSQPKNWSGAQVPYAMLVLPPELGCKRTQTLYRGAEGPTKPPGDRRPCRFNKGDTEIETWSLFPQDGLPFAKQNSGPVTVPRMFPGVESSRT
jgi:hypothetical protein